MWWGVVEVLIVFVDVGERLLATPQEDRAWDAWDALATALAPERPGKRRSAVAELAGMRR